LGLPKVEKIFGPKACRHAKGSSPLSGGGGKKFMSINWRTEYMQTIYVANIKKLISLFIFFFSLKTSAMIKAKRQYISLLENSFREA